MPRELNWIEIDGHAVPASSQGLDILGWAAWMQAHNEQRRVSQDQVGEWDISTVFLGIDHNHSLHGPPLLYETMIFASGSSMDLACWRYHTREAAEEGHNKVVKALQAGASVEAVNELEIEP